MPRPRYAPSDGWNMDSDILSFSSSFRGFSLTAPFATPWKGMLASHRQSSVFDKCRTSYQRTRTPTMGERRGNSVRGSNHDIVGLIQRSPSDFRERCIQKLEKLGDTARDSKKHDEAIRHYSNALSLDPTNLNDILLKSNNEVWIVFHVTPNGPQ